MPLYTKQIKFNEYKLYNKILKLSRNKLFYTKLGLSDTFQNRIYLIFLHTSFLLIKIKQKNILKMENLEEKVLKLLKLQLQVIQLVIPTKTPPDLP